MNADEIKKGLRTAEAETERAVDAAGRVVHKAEDTYDEARTLAMKTAKDAEEVGNFLVRWWKRIVALWRRL